MTVPFFKCVGGKRKLVPELMKHVPAHFGAYHEPFVGGGAMWLGLYDAGRLDPKLHTVHLSDTNHHIIDTLVGLRDDVAGVIAKLKSHEAAHRADPKAYYYATRALGGRGHGHGGAQATMHKEALAETTSSAAWFLYISKTCFNGLYRVNKSGAFNAPIGSYKADMVICDADKLRAGSKALQWTDIRQGPFTVSAAYVRKGDLVYYDSPYAPLSVTSNFTAYQKEGFGYDEQLALRDTALALRKRGAHVILSNSAAPMVYELYAAGDMKKRFEIHEVQAARAINSKGDKRGKITELIIVAR